MKGYSFFFCLLIALVTAVAVPFTPDDDAGVYIPSPVRICLGPH